MERLDIISCPTDLTGLGDDTKVFLAGPIIGAEDWQHSIPKIPGITWISPRRESYEGFDYDSQTSWETLGLRISDAILFWIPAPKENIEGRGYAQTTRIEFGENLARGKKIFIGIYPEYNGRKYFENKLEEYSGPKLHDNLEDVLGEVETWLKERKPGVFFTSDTHFSQERALELSKRPFTNIKDMDYTMIERWNKIVPPGSTVYHLGDFGETWPVDYLNGHIKFIMGNYERDGKSDVPEEVEMIGGPIWNLKISGLDLWMSHEPSQVQECAGMKLFGHIHGRQKVKDWVGLDVGVDGNNFMPYSVEDLKFYYEAIMKHYDDEVWC